MNHGVKKVHPDAFAIGPEQLCYVVRIRKGGVVAVRYNFWTGGIVPSKQTDLSILDRMVGMNVCLNRSQNAETPLDLYQEGTLKKVHGEDVFYLEVSTKKEKDRG